MRPVSTARCRFPRARSSLDRQHFEGKVEGAARRNAPRGEALLSVAFVCRDDELALLACHVARTPISRVSSTTRRWVGCSLRVRSRTELHSEEALVPALDDLADARLVREGLLARILRGPARPTSALSLASTRAQREGGRTKTFSRSP